MCHFTPTLCIANSLSFFPLLCTALWGLACKSASADNACESSVPVMLPNPPSWWDTCDLTGLSRLLHDSPGTAKLFPTSIWALVSVPPISVTCCSPKLKVLQLLWLPSLSGLSLVVTRGLIVWCTPRLLLLRLECVFFPWCFALSCPCLLSAFLRVSSYYVGNVGVGVRFWNRQFKQNHINW